MVVQYHEPAIRLRMDKNLVKELYFLRQYVRKNVRIYVNTTKLGVIIPEHLYESPQQVFDLGFNMVIPIPIEVNYEGIKATLSFNRTPFVCHFPWNSVFLIKVPDEEEQFIGFPEDAPRGAFTPQPPPTGTDAPSGNVVPFARPSKPKRELPGGWGGLIPGGKGAA